MIETISISANKDMFVCRCPGCTSPVVQAELTSSTDKENKHEIQYQCKAGHKNVMRLQAAEAFFVKEEVTQTLQPTATTRTKISGVTFENPDGTKRQTLLQHVKPGDPLQIVSGVIGSASVFMVKHEIGILGTIRKDVIQSFAGENPLLPITAKVVQVTGGKGEKTTLGCNIEMTAKVEQPSVPNETPGERSAGQVKQSKTVFVDKNSRNIYHLDRHCSGLKNAVPERLTFAKGVLKARPCKKCAAGLAEEERK